MSTKLIALGTGSAFTMLGRQTNFIIQRNGKNLLIDCGTDIRHSLQKFGFKYTDIDAVYISHAHADHIGGMEYLGFLTYFTQQAQLKSWTPEKPSPIPLNKLYCERGLVHDLWEHSLRGGMEGIEGIDANIDTFFDVRPIDKNSGFEWEGLKFDMVQSMHVSAKYKIVDSFGLMFTDTNGKRVYLTTDVQFAPETSMKAYYNESDVIIHDCETEFKSGVHSHYDNLKTLPAETKAKIRLIHYNDNVFSDFDTWQNKAHEDGFYGFLEPGVVYSTQD